MLVVTQRTLLCARVKCSLGSPRTSTGNYGEAGGFIVANGAASLKSPAGRAGSNNSDDANPLARLASVSLPQRRPSQAVHSEADSEGPEAPRLSLLTLAQ